MRNLGLVLFAFGASIAVGACGARSGLPIDPPDQHESAGATGSGGAGTGGASSASAGATSSTASGVTAVTSSTGTGGSPVTGGTGGTGTGGEGGAPFDAGPDVVFPPDAPLDAVEEPPVDSPVDAPADVVADAPPDVVTDAPPPGCEDAGTTYIYVITEENALYRFYPPDLSFVPIGTIACPGAGTNQPFSMAVDRSGKAFVVFNDGTLYQVSTATAACAATPFVKGQGGFNPTFGMGFSSNKDDTGETLFVAEASSTERLATLDTKTFALSIIAPFSSTLGDAELTGTGDSRLFAFGIDGAVAGSHLAEIDKATATVVSDVIVPVGSGAHAWAFAFWGGDFYFFTSTAVGSSTVTRYHPDDGSIGAVATLDKTIVGAGVSTCAPQ